MQDKCKYKYWFLIFGCRRSYESAGCVNVNIKPCRIVPLERDMLLLQKIVEYSLATKLRWQPIIDNTYWQVLVDL